MAQAVAEYECYKRIRILGEGSFGKAYLVQCVSDGTYCVIKQVDLGKMSDKEKKETLNEAKILEAFNHPNIIKFREVYKTKKGRLCIVMDYADGGDLGARIKGQHKQLFTESLILDWFTQICLAIKHVHDRKVLHRDLKCQNIFLTKSNMIKLGDFGIAKVLSNTRECVKTMVGTPYYLSPELINGKMYSFKSDIWSLGVILYELCALRPPFDGSSLTFLAMKIVKGQYSPIPSVFSKDLRNLLQSILQIDPNKRPNINAILQTPLIQKRAQNFLSESVMMKEFSHTILHNQKFVKNDLKMENIKKVNNEAPMPQHLVEKMKKEANNQKEQKQQQENKGQNVNNLQNPKNPVKVNEPKNNPFSYYKSPSQENNEQPKEKKYVQDYLAEARQKQAAQQAAAAQQKKESPPKIQHNVYRKPIEPLPVKKQDSNEPRQQEAKASPAYFQHAFEAKLKEKKVQQSQQQQQQQQSNWNYVQPAAGARVNQWENRRPQNRNENRPAAPLQRADYKKKQPQQQAATPSNAQREQNIDVGQDFLNNVKKQMKKVEENIAFGGGGAIAQPTNSKQAKPSKNIGAKAPVKKNSNNNNNVPVTKANQYLKQPSYELKLMEQQKALKEKKAEIDKKHQEEREEIRNEKNKKRDEERKRMKQDIMKKMKAQNQIKFEFIGGQASAELDYASVPVESASTRDETDSEPSQRQQNKSESPIKHGYPPASLEPKLLPDNQPSLGSKKKSAPPAPVEKPKKNSLISEIRKAKKDFKDNKSSDNTKGGVLYQPEAEQETQNQSDGFNVQIFVPSKMPTKRQQQMFAQQEQSGISSPGFGSPELKKSPDSKEKPSNNQSPFAYVQEESKENVIKPTRSSPSDNSTQNEVITCEEIPESMEKVPDSQEVEEVEESIEPVEGDEEEGEEEEQNSDEGENNQEGINDDEDEDLAESVELEGEDFDDEGEDEEDNEEDDNQRDENYYEEEKENGEEEVEEEEGEEEEAGDDFQIKIASEFLRISKKFQKEEGLSNQDNEQLQDFAGLYEELNNLVENKPDENPQSARYKETLTTIQSQSLEEEDREDDETEPDNGANNLKTTFMKNLTTLTTEMSIDYISDYSKLESLKILLEDGLETDNFIKAYRIIKDFFDRNEDLNAIEEKYGKDKYYQELFPFLDRIKLEKYLPLMFTYVIMEEMAENDGNVV